MVSSSGESAACSSLFGELSDATVIRRPNMAVGLQRACTSASGLVPSPPSSHPAREKLRPNAIPKDDTCHAPVMIVFAYHKQSGSCVSGASGSAAGGQQRAAERREQAGHTEERIHVVEVRSLAERAEHDDDDRDAEHRAKLAHRL